MSGRLPWSWLLVLVLVMLAATALPGAAGELSLEVRLEPQELGIEHLARLSVIVWGADQGATLQLGALDNLEVLQGPFSERQLTWINGVATAATRFTYQLRPLQLGPATVGIVTVTVASTSLTSERPITIAVVPEDPTARRRSGRLPIGQMAPVHPGGSDLREARVELRQLVSNPAPFLGEPVIVSLVLDTNVAGVEHFELITPPAFPGWWAQRLLPASPPAPQLVEVDGFRYSRTVLASHALIPLVKGELTIPPVKARIGLRGRSLFVPGQRLERTTDAVKVQVRGRPEAPEGFTGGVGSLHYRAMLEPSAITLGESAVLTIELSGAGNLPLVSPPPAWPSCQGCDAYPPEELSQLEVDESGIRGTRTWRTSLVPRQVGDLALEPITLVSFDPHTGTYKEQTIGGLALQVLAPAATPVATLTTGPDPGRPPQHRSGGTGLWFVLGLVAGLLGGLLVARRLAARNLAPAPALGQRSGQPPAERARQLQLLLEQWWQANADQQPALRREMEQLRRELEGVRFAPGRADHSETVIDIEHRIKSLLRRS